MRCEDAIKNMDRFVNHKMTTGELEDFLKHVDSCPSCYEELETYYTVAIALHYLEKNDGEGYNIPLRLQHTLDAAHKRVRRERRYYISLHVILFVLIIVLVLMIVFSRTPAFGMVLRNLFLPF